MQGYEKIIYFYLFAFMRNAYQTRYGVIDPITNLVIGYVSNWCQLPFTMPVDTCVNGMITTGRSFGTMVKTVLANPAGAYKGMAAYSIAALKPAIQFTVYEQMRWSAEPARSSSSASELTRRCWRTRRALASNGGPNPLLTARQAFIMGAISRVVSDTMIYPARRVKTTRQTLASRVASGQLTQKEADELLSRGTVGLITHIVKESGFMSLYVVRSIPPSNRQQTQPPSAEFFADVAWCLREFVCRVWVPS